MIYKFDRGGSTPPLVSYTYAPRTRAKSAPVSSESKNNEDSGTKLLDKRLDSALNSLDALPNDTAALRADLDLFSIDKESGYLPSHVLEQEVNRIVMDFKIASYRKKEHDNAIKTASESGGLNEIAINEKGFMLCQNTETGEYEEIPFSLFKKELGKYIPLSTNDVLRFSAWSPEFAGNTKSIHVARTSIGLPAISTMINNAIRKLGTTEYADEGMTLSEAGVIKQGIEYLKKAEEEAEAQGLDTNLSVEGLYNLGILTKDLSLQAKAALKYISSMLPKNAKTLLQYKALENGIDADNGDEIMIAQLLTSGINETKRINVSGKNSKGTALNSKTVNDTLEMSPVMLMLANLAEQTRMIIQNGTEDGLYVSASLIPITSKEGNPLGNTTLEKIINESQFGGVFDSSSITMGGEEIQLSSSMNVLVDGNNMFIMMLPVDPYAPKGITRPYMELLTKVEEANEIISKLSADDLKDVTKINQAYQQAGLPPLLNADGSLATGYRRFAVFNGHAMDTAFVKKKPDSFDSGVTLVEDDNLKENILETIDRNKNKEDRYNNLSRGFLKSKHKIYEGTIFIPVSSNTLTGMMSSGIKPKAADAMTVYEKEQLKERLKAQGGYHDTSGLAAEIGLNYNI